MGDFDAPLPGSSLFDEAGGPSRSIRGGKWISTLTTLESGPHVEQLLVLGELSTFLSYASEENLVGFPSWSYMKVLMHIINSPGVKYVTLRVKPRGSSACPSESTTGGQFPFYELLTAIYKNKMQGGGSDAVGVSVGGGGSASSICGTHDMSASSDDLSGTSAPDPPDDEPISEDMAANKAITAAACLNTILDILPHAASFFMTNGSQLDVLKQKLNDIQYIDLAERILLIYEKLVKEIPVTVVKSGSLLAMLQYVDFFPIDVQVGTFTSIMNAIKKVERAESFRSYLVPLIPYLSQALSNGNKKIVQLSCCIWKVIIGAGVRAAQQSDAHGADLMSTMVHSVASSGAVKEMCRLVFTESGKLRRANVNQCLFCVSIMANESCEVVSQLFSYEILPHVSRWLSHGGEDTLLRLVDLGLAMLGSFHTSASLSSGPSQLRKRAEYFRSHTDHLVALAGTFQMHALMGIFDGTISQNLRNRTMLLHLRLLEMAGEVDEARSRIVASIPLHKLMTAVCYILRYHNRDEKCEVAVHVVMCLLRLLDGDLIGETLRRHGVSQLLGSVRSSNVANEISHILGSIPADNVSVATKTGHELIAEIKGVGDTLTLYELSNSGLLDLDYNGLLSPDVLPRLLESILSPGSGDTNAPGSCSVESDVCLDGSGLRTLWSAFSRVLEAQPEFKLDLANDDDESAEDYARGETKRDDQVAVDTPKSAVSDVSATARTPTAVNVECTIREATRSDPYDGCKSASSTEGLAMLDSCAIADDPFESVADSSASCAGTAAGAPGSASESLPGVLDLDLGDGLHGDVGPIKLRLNAFLRSSGRAPRDLDSESHHRQGERRHSDADSAASDPTEDNTAMDVAPPPVAVTREELLRSVDVLCGLCEDLVPGSSKSKVLRVDPDGETSEITDRPHRPKKSEGRSKKSMQHHVRIRNRLRGALGLINQFTKTDSLPFPFNYMNRDVKIKLKCVDSDDDLATLPLLSIYTSPLVTVSKVESYILMYLNRRAQEGEESSSSAPKKRAKTESMGQAEPDGLYVSAQLFRRGTPLSPTMSIYRVLFGMGSGDSGNIWESSNVLQYSLTRRGDGSSLQQLHAGRHTPLMTPFCDDRHSPIGLYMGFLGYVNGRCTCNLDSMITEVKERLSSLDIHAQREAVCDGATQIQAVLQNVNSARLSAPASANGSRPSGGRSSRDASGAVAVGWDDPGHSDRMDMDGDLPCPGDSDTCGSIAGFAHIGAGIGESTAFDHHYLARRVAECLRRMDDLMLPHSENDGDDGTATPTSTIGSTVNDVLMASRMPRLGKSELGAASSRQLRMLAVLQCLFNELNVFMGNLELRTKFSKRLTLKLLTLLGKLEESLCYLTPSWFIDLVMVCPGLFSFESRRVLFDVLTAGPHRLLYQFHGRLGALVDVDGAATKGGEATSHDALDEILRQRLLSAKPIKVSALQEVEGALHLPKLKTACSRDGIVKSASLVMERLVRSAPELDTLPKLEVEFENEVGVGSGPTQEFYSLVVERIFQGGCVGVSDDDSGTTDPPFEELGGYAYPRVYHCSDETLGDLTVGMFMRARPSASPTGEGDSSVELHSGLKDSDTPLSRVFRTFKLLGQLCASALLDRKLLDLRLHPLFWHQCQQPSAELNCSLTALHGLDPALAQSLRNLMGSPDLDSAELFFTYNGVPVTPDGSGRRVTRENVRDYVRAVVKLRLYDGVRVQVWAFRLGFATVAPLESLSLFTPTELSNSVFNTGDQGAFWTVDHLQSHIVPDHGYDATSTAYREFIAVLAAFSEYERRQFLRFCTGAPVLPKQGFAGLRPIMRVVKKGENTDELPSVMTCSNYFKLPNYASFSQVRCKLLQAMCEGQGSFNLS